MIRQEFFEQREQKLDEYRAKGYQPLDEFMQQTGISEQQLMEVGLLQVKEITSTAELVDYETTAKGREYLKELKRMQLILVSEKKQQTLRSVVG